jgi:hypothetical protein
MLARGACLGKSRILGRMDDEGEVRPILTRRTVAAANIGVALVSSMTGFNLARDGEGAGRIGLVVSVTAAVALVSLGLTQVLAIWARRYRDTPREPIVLIVAMALVWGWIVGLFLLGMVVNHGSPRRVLIMGALAGGVTCVVGALTYLIALRARWRRKARP